MATLLDTLAGQLPPMPQRLLIGLSGGADSVALYLLLLQRGSQLTAVHVNHGLRGSASDGDEQFVRELCLAHGTPLLVYRAVPPAHPGEDWARQARYGFFRQAMQASGAEALVLAHHRDDQAETLLLHLLRGAGLTGLCGMSPDSAGNGLRILRPLLGMTRQQLRDALIEVGQPWREDLSNANPRYLRNAVRAQLLPLMEQLAPGAAGRIADAAAALQADEAALHAQAAAVAAPWENKPWLPLRTLTPLPAGMQARVLRLWWQSLRSPDVGERSLTHQQTEGLLRLIGQKPSQQCNLPSRCRAYRGWQCIHFLSPADEAAETPAVPMTDLGAALRGFHLHVLPSQGSPGNGRIAQEVPRSLLQGCVLRTWQPGDFICPYGSAGRQALQDYFVNKRVDAPFRRQIPLLCRGHEVLLAGGVGAGDIPRFDPDSDPVRLIWQGEMPWLNDADY